MDDYDIAAAFEAIENELIKSMMANMSRHRLEEKQEGMEWSMWQTEQLKAFGMYKKNNQKKYSKQFADINGKIEKVIRAANQKGGMEQEMEILKAVKNGFTGYKKASSTMQAEFFKINERKLEALIKATMANMERAETAILRMSNDKYRKIIFNAQVYANTGAGTYEKAVDMATKDMLSAGLNCVEYKNGARHTLTDYARMAIQTASKRAYLQGEGEKRKEWGISLVIMNKRGNPCPKCLPFVGKILIDDVWSGGSKGDGKYPLMSSAIAAGLYHSRCKDGHTTYFEGVSSEPDSRWTKDEIEAIESNYKKEQKENYAENQAKRFERLAEYSLDSDNKRIYTARRNDWQQRIIKEDSVQAGKQYKDVLEEWLKDAKPNTHEIIKLEEYSVCGITYKVDNINVKQNNSRREIEVAQLLKDVFGGEIKLVPEINGKYTGVSTPDYIFKNQKWDLKELNGSGKDAVRDAIKKKYKQADNFIIDITKCKLTEKEVLKQAESVFSSNNTRFVNNLMIIKENEIISVLKRI